MVPPASTAPEYKSPGGRPGGRIRHMPKAPSRPATLPLLLALLALAFPAAAAGTHPFSVQDMLAMDRVSEPAVSPDGKLVAFTLRTTDLAANRGRTDVWLLDVATKGLRRLTTHEAGDSSPRWAPDGRTLYFLSTRSGSSQVWKLSLLGGEPEAVTKEPLDLEGFDLSPDGRTLLLGMAVFPGKSPAETKAALDDTEKSKASGMLFDRLFVRHWDTWSNGTRNHLFAFPLPAGPAVDLMKGMDADCPTKPFGGMEDAAVSPDGTERRLLVELSVSVEEPFGGEATVVVRLRFSGEAPGEDETVRENLWETAAAFLAEAQARSAAAAPDAPSGAGGR
ncbi:hypothetical protein FBQ97_04825, partial [Acidobacteria bacterium ACD]|nr:hypothetical protein [Acidobacteria bacterium ACD]